MARRSRDWEEGLAKDLKRTVKARKEFFLALLEEGYEWREALDKIVKLVGVKEYCEFVGDIKPSNLLNQLNSDSNITIETLERLTKPLGIELTFRDKSKDKNVA